MKKQDLVVFVYAAIIGIVSALIMQLQGCAFFQKSCDTAVKNATHASVLLSDATIAVDRAAAIFYETLEEEAARNASLGLIEDARKALRFAAVATDATITSCEAHDPMMAFQDFLNAWKEIEKLLRLVRVGDAEVGAYRIVIEPPLVSLYWR